MIRYSDNSYFDSIFGDYRWPWYLKRYPFPEIPYYPPIYKEPCYPPVYKEPELIYPKPEDVDKTLEKFGIPTKPKRRNEDMKTVKEYMKEINPKKYIITKATGGGWRGVGENLEVISVIDNCLVFDTVKDALTYLVKNLVELDNINNYSVDKIDVHGKVTLSRQTAPTILIREIQDEIKEIFDAD